MIWLANVLGRVMMTAVNTRQINAYDDLKLYSKAEFRKEDKDYILFSLSNKI